MAATNPIENFRDKGGRRSGEDRRKAVVLYFVPDRRCGLDRRMSQERRNRNEADYISYLKRNSDRFMEFANTQKGVLYGFLLSLPVWALILYWIIMRGNPKF